MSVLVTVICLCHNQAAYVEAALDSIKQQTYPYIQLIVIDDGSTDTSAKKIAHWLAIHNPQAEAIYLSENRGNCKAFNQGLAKAKGKYIIDLAADDVMHPGKITRQVQFFEEQPLHTALIYSNANYVDERSRFLWIAYFKVNKTGKVRNELALSGDRFVEILSTHFIVPPTTMCRTEVLKELNGYDEALVYEDWDLYVRLGRKYAVAFQDEVLMDIRVVPKSHGNKLNPRREAYLLSTAIICRKAKALCHNDTELQALVLRVKYELRSAAKEGIWKAVKEFGKVLISLDSLDISSRILLMYANWKS